MRNPSILPPNATKLERTLESATWRLGDNGPQGIRALWSAAAIPASLLPWLAWALNIDAWDSAWDEAKKRSVVGSALRLHSSDGTLAAVRRVTELHGGTVTKVVRPPCQLYYGPTPTKEQRDATLAIYPQLILRTKNEPFLAAPGATFPRRSYMGHCYGLDVGAVERILPRAFIQDLGSTTECAVSAVSQAENAPTYLQVKVPLTNEHGTYAGGFPKFGVAVEAPVYVLQTTQSYEGPGLGVNYKLLSAGVEPTQVYPDWISETYPAQGTFPGSNFMRDGIHWRASEAESHIYARLYLFEASRTLEASGRSYFLDAVHTGIAPHTARIRSWFPLRRSPSSPSFYGHGYLAGEDYQWLTRYFDSLARCSSLRDTILVDTRNYAVISCTRAQQCDPATTCGAMLPRD